MCSEAKAAMLWGVAVVGVGEERDALVEQHVLQPRHLGVGQVGEGARLEVDRAQ